YFPFFLTQPQPPSLFLEKSYHQDIRQTTPGCFVKPTTPPHPAPVPVNPPTQWMHSMPPLTNSLTNSGPPCTGQKEGVLLPSKVAFSVSFMKDYAATWSQPYLEKVYNGQPVVFIEFLNDFKSSFFNHKHQCGMRFSGKTLNLLFFIIFSGFIY
ncbi:uncharacterized protein VP01_1681g1, partial [Puccinia sorghi]